MKRDFAALKEPFDLIIIGGGIIGTGAARDAALRGLRTLIVEREDFGYGTTSRSTRLIHGGLRYLAQFDFGLVHKDLHEREILLKIAPHLVHRLEFVIPLLKSAPYYRVTLPFGLWLYNRFSHGSSLPPSNHLSAKEALAMEPSLKDTAGLVGAYLYYDGQAAYTERLCIENLIDASAHGAVILNHTLATELLSRDGTVTGVKIKDLLSGGEHSVSGRIILNASGPWADTVLHKVENGRGYALRKTKGIHLFTDKISNNALVLFAKSDGRLFFVIPLLGHSLIGTTDTDYTGDLDKVHAEKADVDYLVSELGHYFPSFKREMIHYTYAGLRPLVPSGKKSASKTSRAHRLVDHEPQDGVKGFVSVLGGKNTAYRGIAEEAVNLIVNKLGMKANCTTAQTQLPGAPAVSAAEIEKVSAQSGLPTDTISHLASIYGSRYGKVLAYAREEKRLGNPISHGGKDILAQIKQAVKEEAAVSVSDFMMRRSLISLRPEQGLDAVEAVAKEMAALLGWNAAETSRQVAEYSAMAALGQLYKGE
ncbi:MAG TPA: glycerol-3-phosphate dehydrogenase/oxidase [Dehalococcoidales bacterium]|nr:glycerol-3-phosphate dehydrogenase/oxidase [Dehalococcoidales bacterium]